jgi:DNA-binding PadR family transcriptional regulator
MSEPSLSPTQAVLLELLEDGSERYPLELVEMSSGRIKAGTVYVTLSRMETRGFVSSRREERSPTAIGLPRRFYRATAYGLRVLGAYRALRKTLSWEPAR